MDRDEKGRYKSEHGVSPTKVRDEMELGRPYTTGELAGLLGAPRRTVFNYLVELHESGEIERKQPAERQSIWWIPR